MKNVTLKLIGVMLLLLMLVGASKPSVEGRASVADAGELPQGMFIKAHGFLPGDSVIVTNPSTKVSVEAFVFETIDQGLAAIVSVEVAEKLFITNNSDTLVQIRKVVASADIAEANLVIYENEEPIVAVEEESVLFDDSIEYVAQVETAEVIEEVAVETISNDIIETAAEEEVLEPIQESASVAMEDEIVENQIITEITEIIVSAEETLYDSEAEGIASEEVLEDTELVFTPFADMTSLFATDVGQETLVEESNEIVSDAELIAEEEIVETIIVFDEEIIPETIIDSIVISEGIEEELAMETPNVLTPTEEKPAVLEGIAEEPIVTFVMETSEEINEEPIEDFNTIDVFALTPATEYVEETNFSANINDFIVDNISAVDSKKFFIQLATYKDRNNINKVLNAYAEKYPFALVASPSINGAYQVVVGPLTKDEYTVVLERFKSYGYKDAFLRIAE